MPAEIEHHGLWELAVLCFLREGPMHPYEMQRLVRERHKDDVLVLKRGSLYHAIRRLQRARLIEAVKTSREGRRPERTTYRITAEGEQELIRWLRQLIAVPQREPSVFLASISFLVYLKPEDAVAQLEQRVAILQQEIEGMGQALEALVHRVGRINLLETEYARAMREAERAWAMKIIEEIRAGTLVWDIEAILEFIRAYKKSASGLKTKSRTEKTPTPPKDL